MDCEEEIEVFLYWDNAVGKFQEMSSLLFKKINTRGKISALLKKESVGLCIQKR